MDTVTGWYFSEESRLLRYGDARPIAIGVTHAVDAPIELCRRGLHASVRAIDALEYAPGPIVWRVELSGEIKAGHDKCVATRRTYIAGGVDASVVMRALARRCALDVAHMWDMPDVVREYLTTGDESIRAAAWAVAWAVAGAAAGAAAWATAGDAAWATAGAAAWAAARATAGAAASDAQNAHFESMLMELCK